MPPTPKPPLPDGKWEALWALHVDTVDRLSTEVNRIIAELGEVKIQQAVANTKLAMIGGLSGIAGSILSGVVVYFLKK